MWTTVKGNKTYQDLEQIKQQKNFFHSACHKLEPDSQIKHRVKYIIII